MVNNEKLFEWVPFDEVWQVLEKHFVSDDFFNVSKFPYGPNPETIYRLVQKKYGLFDVAQIPDWESYDYGKIEYSNEYFTEKLFGNIDIDEVPFFYIIINKCFTERKVLKVKGKDLLKFIDTAPKLIEYHIMQPCDVIFIADAPFKVAVMDHNGYYMPIDTVETFST